MILMFSISSGPQKIQKNGGKWPLPADYGDIHKFLRCFLRKITTPGKKFLWLLVVTVAKNSMSAGDYQPTRAKSRQVGSSSRTISCLIGLWFLLAIPILSAKKEKGKQPTLSFHSLRSLEHLLFGTEDGVQHCLSTWIPSLQLTSPAALKASFIWHPLPVPGVPVPSVGARCSRQPLWTFIWTVDLKII